MVDKITLDDFEKDIENNISKQQPLDNLNEELEMLQSAAREHKKKKKSITIRLSENDLEAVKIKASKLGIPYQTYINLIIHKDASTL